MFNVDAMIPPKAKAFAMMFGFMSLMAFLGAGLLVSLSKEKTAAWAPAVAGVFFAGGSIFWLTRKK
jgi:hypothetical protein